MIRGNYSLAKEVRKNETRQRQKIQQRQKKEHQLQRLKDVDPIRLYLRLERLKGEPHLDKDQLVQLQKLKDDWAFIEKNQLHKEKLKPFLESQEKKRVQREKEQKKLWAKESIYFNPELNPLGKVPNISKVGMDVQFPNARVPIKKKTTYSPDPLIAELGIQPPEGEPPRFYKMVQNISIEPDEKPHLQKIDSQKGKKQKASLKSSVLDSDSDAEIYSDDESDAKRRRLD